MPDVEEVPPVVQTMLNVPNPRDDDIAVPRWVVRDNILTATGSMYIGNIAAGAITSTSITGNQFITITSPASTTFTLGSGDVLRYGNNITINYDPPPYLTEPAEPTADELDERERRRAEWNRRDAEMRERERERMARVAAATERADALLLSVLDAAQAAQYRTDETFAVVGSAGGRYRIRRGTMGNVDALDADGEWIGSLCAHPSMSEHAGGQLPTPDVMLAQLLHLTTDEADFVDTANVHAGRRPVVRSPVAA